MRKKSTSASELAEMGYCEKKMLFERRLGQRVSRERIASREEGLAAHNAFHRDAVRVAPTLVTSEAKPWCFIASELFGPAAPETAVLRRFRDGVLRGSAPGRAFIGAYYRYSPGCAHWLRRHPLARAVARTLLRLAVLVLLRCMRRLPGAEKVGR